MNKLIYTLFFICFSLFTVKGQNIVINEYSAANYNTFQDNYGEYEDWVELYNTSAVAIDIDGWTITDKPSNPAKWTIPSSFIIPANGVAIIYCSGRDELIGGNAHTNFKITQTKGNEVFMISDASGVFQDSIQVLPNQKSHTRGRETNGSLIWSVFTSGTPNASNFGAMQEYAMTPIFSQSGGYNTGNVSLTLSSPEPDITIYYTLNGDAPDSTSIMYTIGTAINISVTTVVKAIAYSSTANIHSSFIDYHTFFINDIHTVPILSISGDQVDNLLNGNQIEPDGTLEWFDTNGVLLDKGTGEYNKHGNDSWAYAQRGFDFVMRDQFGYNYALKDKIFDTKSRDKFQRIIVKAAANDNYPFSYGGSGAHIRDAYVHHLSQLADLRVDERSTSSCILYLNGEYWGVYEMREKVDDTDFLSYYYDQDEIYRESADYLQYLKTWGGTWTKYGDGMPGPGSIARNDWDDFVDFVAANPMVNQVNYNQAKSQYNMGSLIDYFLLNSYVVCQDWLNYNTAWWRGMDPNGEKKKWRYTLWDMDNTFDHGTNYTGIPSSSPTAEPCDASTLGNSGGQGHVPIWNEMLTNQEFHDDYINRWQDLANGPLSCTFMIHILDSMIAVIEPEMPRQIATWGGTYTGWENNVATLRNWILARCDSMNSGFVDCDTAITGIFDVTVEIIGIGEVEMSNSNIINNLNSPFTDQRFGGIDLPFKVVSGPFDHWEIISANTYIFDPNVDTLVLDLQSDVTVQAYFTPTRDITYNVSPIGTATTINVDGVIINVFPTTISYPINQIVNISPNLDPLYEFSSWSSDSVLLMPNANSPIASFSTSNIDTVTLNIVTKPTITYMIDPALTTSSINVDGVIINTFPTSIVYPTNQIVNISANLDPLYEFNSWGSDNVILTPTANSPIASFSASNNDTVILYISKKPTITYMIDPTLTTSTINSDGIVIGTFPTTIPYPTNQIVNISANLDPLYGFSSWSSDSVLLLPTANSPIASFSVSNSDTVTLNIYQKPTIIYYVDPPGTTTSIDINGNIVSVFPYSETVFIDALNIINPDIDPLFSFNSWRTNSNFLLNGGLANNSFYGEYNDSVILKLSQMSAFISNISSAEQLYVCSNQEDSIKVSFANGIAPYSFVYAINGVNQTAIPTSKNPHYIKVRETGTYTLTYFSDSSSTSNIMNGSVEVIVMDKPIAMFSTDADTITILNTTLKLQDISQGNIVSWYWDFGDELNSYDQNPYHSYDEKLGVYQISLIATDDMGCSDTTSKNIWISDDYWMYIPNSFTPDNDGVNDLFCLTHHGIREATFVFNVYDRFSNLVYATNKIADLECFLNTNGWDGKHYKTGNNLPMGSYIYEVYFQDFEGWKNQDIGNIFIVR